MYQIAELAKAKEIKYLVHFARVENLPSIALYGLISRQLLVQNNLPHFYNDNLRLDNLPNTISLSVTFPNYKMFFKYRGSNKWVVILLNAYKILEKFECIFNYTNAANHEIRDTDIEQRKGIAAFQYMLLFRPRQRL